MLRLVPRLARLLVRAGARGCLGPSCTLPETGFRMRTIRSRRFEIRSGLASVTLPAARRGPLDPATLGPLAASAPDLEHVFPSLRPGGAKLFHGSRGWHGSGAFPAKLQLLPAGGDPRPAPSTAAIVPALSRSISGTATSSGQPSEPENQGDNDRDQYADQEEGEVGAGERDERCCSAATGGECTHAVAQSAAAPGRGWRSTNPSGRHAQASKRCLQAAVGGPALDEQDLLGRNLRSASSTAAIGSASPASPPPTAASPARIHSASTRLIAGRLLVGRKPVQRANMSRCDHIHVRRAIRTCLDRRTKLSEGSTPRSTTSRFRVTTPPYGAAPVRPQARCSPSSIRTSDVPD
jgi:hypothetical protein